MDLLDELHRSGRTVVLITHDPDVAEASSAPSSSGTGRSATAPAPA